MPHQQSGFTLIEMMIVMGISSIIMVALLFFFSGSLNSYRSQVGNIIATASARVQIRRITNILRNAQNNASTSESWLQEANDNSVTVWTDMNGDGTLEKVQYARISTAPTRLTRCVTNGAACTAATTTTIAQNIANVYVTEPLFFYYDSSGNVISQVSDRTAQNVRSIGVQIISTSNNPKNTNPQGISTRVTPRQNLQGTISGIVQPDATREVAIELPRGYPPAGLNVTIVTKNTGTGATTSSTIPITSLNDGRVSILANTYPAIINYKKNTGFGNSAWWYVWINASVPSVRNLYPILISTLYTNQCLGVSWAAVQATSTTSCVPLQTSLYPIAASDTYQPILTYTAGTNRDYIRTISVLPPVLTSFTSSTANGTYGPGSTVNITATYDESLASGSTLAVILDTGASVTLSTVSGASVSGTYTVGATGSGENSSDLNVTSITSESVSDTYTPSATRTNSSVPANNIATTSNIIIDTIAPSSPIATPPGATYSLAKNVTLSAEALASIRYTTNGSSPTSTSTLYSGAILVNSTTTLKAIAIDIAGNKSVVMTESYVMNCTAGTIDFERLPSGTIPSESTSINNQYTTINGISFSLAGGGYPYITKIGSPRTAFQSSYGDDTPNTAGQPIVQSYFLSSKADLIATYNPPVTEASGVLVDIDTGESWTLTAKNSVGVEVGSWAMSNATCGSLCGEGKASQWIVTAPSGQSFTTLTFVGTRPSGYPGYGIDTISSKPTVCPL